MKLPQELIMTTFEEDERGPTLQILRNESGRFRYRLLVTPERHVTCKDEVISEGYYTKLAHALRDGFRELEGITLDRIEDWQEEPDMKHATAKSFDNYPVL